MSTPGTSRSARPGQLLLTINAGSSSLKAAVFARGDKPRRLFSARVERIGSQHAQLEIRDEAKGSVETVPVKASGHRAAGEALFARVEGQAGPGALAAIGHRLVHGGPDHGAPARVTPALVTELRKLGAFDPEHLPAELDLVTATLRCFPGLPQVACFDTAFHWNLPRVARLLPIPRRFEARGVRRYGFHGLSYAYLMAELARVAGPEAAAGRVVLAHLGSGASLAAVRDGQSVDTTMGLTPAGGIPMGTRAGDLDPGLGWYLARREKISPRKFNEMIHHRSGLLGLSETSADLRDLLACEREDPRAHDAVSLFCYQARKGIAAMAAALGGIDTLVFAGGIGENQAEIRTRICAELDFLGLVLAPETNARQAAVISPPGARVTVRVMRTDEELTIARELQRILFSAPG